LLPSVAQPPWFLPLQVHPLPFSSSPSPRVSVTNQRQFTRWILRPRDLEQQDIIIIASLSPLSHDNNQSTQTISLMPNELISYHKKVTTRRGSKETTREHKPSIDELVIHGAFGGHRLILSHMLLTIFTFLW
jgi:hypothetical protein